MRLRLVGKLKPCDSCGLTKTKAKPISAVSHPLKKSSTVGEIFLVDVSGLFPLTATHWHKATRTKLFLHRVSDQFSGKMLTSFQHSEKERVVLIDGSLKCFKGCELDVKHTRMDDSGENQPIVTACKDNEVKVEHVPLGTPKLNNVVERGFSIRLETTNTLIQNARPKPSMKKNVKTLVEATRTACFSKE